MLYVIIVISLVLIGAVFIYAVKHGLNVENIIEKINTYISSDGQPPYHIGNDDDFYAEVLENLHCILGKKRYTQLEVMSKSVRILGVDKCSGVSRFYACIYCEEHEKQQIESIICNLVKKHLTIHGICCENVISNWSVRTDFNMQVLQIRFGETKEEQAIINRLMAYEKNTIVKQNGLVIDDTEDEDLTDDE